MLVQPLPEVEAHQVLVGVEIQAVLDRVGRHPGRLQRLHGQSGGAVSDQRLDVGVELVGGFEPGDDGGEPGLLGLPQDLQEGAPLVVVVDRQGDPALLAGLVGELVGAVGGVAVRAVGLRGGHRPARPGSRSGRGQEMQGGLVLGDVEVLALAGRAGDIRSHSGGRRRPAGAR